MTLWQEDNLSKYRYYPKDVGHERSVLQAFSPENRKWSEVELSTLLMLHIDDMV